MCLYSRWIVWADQSFFVPQHTHSCVFCLWVSGIFLLFYVLNIIYCYLVSLCFHVSCLAAMVLEILLCFLVMTDDDDDDDDEFWSII